MEILDISALDQGVIERFDEIIRPHQAQWPYHNEPHGWDASEDTLPQAEWCIKNGQIVARKPLFFGMRGHDIGIHEDFKAMGFDTAEEYAAFLTGNALDVLGFDKNEIALAKEIVVITNPSLKPTTIEHKIARRADVGNIGRSFVPFVAKSGLLWQEEIFTTGNYIGYEPWAKKACKFLIGQVLAPDLSLGEFDQLANSFSQARARVNVNKLGQMLARVADIFESASEPTVGSPYPDYETLLAQQGIR